MHRVGHREAMARVNANVAAPISVAAAADVLSDDSLDTANPEQDVAVDESTQPGQARAGSTARPPRARGPPGRCSTTRR